MINSLKPGKEVLTKEAAKMKMYAILVMLLVMGCGKDGASVVGPTGPVGPAGSTGAIGQTGVPGTAVTPVELCPASFVPSYPSTFPEYALCIGNSLYGVYSANGGFLALLPPGTYSSVGINATCTVVVGANCHVSF